MKRFQKGQFNMNDLKAQLQQMQKMGGMQGVMGMLPGMGKMQKQMDEAGLDDRMLRRQIALINSMTRKERRNPELLQASRKRRVAAGAGLEVQDLNRLLKMHRQMADMMKKVGGMGKKGLLRGGLGALLGKGAPQPAGRRRCPARPARCPPAWRCRPASADWAARNDRARPRHRAPDAAPAPGGRLGSLSPPSSRATRRAYVGGPAAAPAPGSASAPHVGSLGPAAASAPGRSTRRATRRLRRPGRALSKPPHFPEREIGWIVLPAVPAAAASPPRPPAPPRAFAYAHARLDHRRQLRRPRQRRARSPLARRLGCVAGRRPPTRFDRRGHRLPPPGPGGAAMSSEAIRRAADLLRGHRKSIDRLDAILVFTLAERFKHTQAVGVLKAAARPAAVRPGARVGADRAARAAGRGGRPRPGLRAQVPELHHLGSDPPPRAASRKRAGAHADNQGD